MSTYLHLKKAEKNKLDFFGIENSDYELNELLGFALGIDCRDSKFLDMLSDEADEKIADEFHQLCSRRVVGEPLQYILGQWEFYGIPIKVGECLPPVKPFSLPFKIILLFLESSK